MRIKVFGPFDGTDDMETLVQGWLDKHPEVEIHHFAQTQDGSWVSSTILYTIKES